MQRYTFFLNSLHFGIKKIKKNTIQQFFETDVVC
jgi:hypothetical protein